MKKISSRQTFLLKWILPLFVFGFIGIFFLINTVFLIFEEEKFNHLLGFCFAIFMFISAVIGYRKLVLTLADKVYDEGSTLLFIKGGKEARVPLSDVKNVGYTPSSASVTISLRNETPLGREITFLPPARYIPFTKQTCIVDLIDRIDKTRR